MKKYLCILTSSALKVMLLTPVLRGIKTQLPNALLHFITDDGFKHLVKNNSYIDQLFLLNNNSATLQAELSMHQYEAVFDFDNEAFTHQMAASTGAPIFFEKTSLLQKLKEIFQPKKNIPDKYFSIAASTGIVNDGKGLDFFMAEKEKIGADDLPTSHLAGYIALMLLPSLSIDWYKQVCAQINHPIILLGDETDKQKGAAIAEADDVKIYSAAGKFSFNEMAYIMASSKLLVAEANEYLLIAIAKQVKTVALWPAKAPKFDLSNCYHRLFLAKQTQRVFIEDSCTLKNHNIHQVIAAIKKLQFG